MTRRDRSASRVRRAAGAVTIGAILGLATSAATVQANELAQAPRIVAAQENRVILGRGDTAYVRGDLTGGTDYRIFREPKALVDPTTKEILGYEAFYVGSAEYTRQGETRVDAAGK